MRAKTWFILGCLIVTAGAYSVASGDEEKSRSKGNFSDSAQREKGRIWESLSEEQRTQLKEALRDVWSDPAVLSAREDVKQASDSYQNAVRDAIKRVDPSVSELVARLQSASEGEARDRLGGGMQMKFGPRRGGDYPMGPPGYLDKLSPEQKERYQKAQEKARESEAVKAAKEELESIREQDSELRRRQLAAHKKMRRVMLESMVEADPGIEELQKQVHDGDRRGRPGGPKDSGSERR